MNAMRFYTSWMSSRQIEIKGLMKSARAEVKKASTMKEGRFQEEFFVVIFAGLTGFWPRKTILPRGGWANKQTASKASYYMSVTIQQG